ncbi:MAG TPA: phosphocholine cytidylyltransferase family protein [Bacteroidota bacterium]|nr:phosphocholine cytidylyltransferase family protein [Bacteroidota bacterium]
MNSSIENTPCVILAAGISRRLRPLTDDRPKCLLEVNGTTILQRMLENIFATGIRRVAIVVGYKAEMIREHLRAKFSQKRFKFILNPNYSTTNNAYSLLLAKKFLEDENGKVAGNFLLLDSDLVFISSLLPEFLSHAARNKIAVRILGEHNDEEIGVTVNAEGIITNIGKHLAGAVGESVGMELFAPSTATKLFRVLEQRVHSGIGRTEFYEASFQQLIEHGTKLSMVNVDSFPVIEIDTPEDYRQAQQLILC